MYDGCLKIMLNFKKNKNKNIQFMYDRFLKLIFKLK